MNEFDKAFEIVLKLQGAGYEAFFVGGWVRDHILGIQSNDIDIATSALSNEVKELFPDCQTDVGTLFHVNIVNGIEVATYRHDVDGDFPLFAECFLEDSSRRDLTINSIGYDPVDEELIDYWCGKSDIENKLIRFVEIAQARIEEDPVRMLRACRFAAKIEGRLVPSAFFAIKDNVHLIDDIPRERIQKEIFKVLSTCDKPSIFFELLQRTGLLARIIPELDDCWWHDGGNHHSEFVHEHLLSAVDHVQKDYPIVRLAALFHDIGKVEAYDEINFTFLNHEKFGTDLTRDVLTNLRFSSSIVEAVTPLVLLHMRVIDANGTKRSYRRTLAKLEKHGVSLRDFLLLKIADRHANARREDYTPEEINEIIANFENIDEEENAAFSVKDLAVDGNDVIKAGTEAGPTVGLILNHLLDLVLDDPRKNSRRDLLELLEDDSYWQNWFYQDSQTR